MNRQSSPRQLNYSHALLIAGLVLSLLVVMFRPAGAEAVLPLGIDVFETSDTTKTKTTVDVGDLKDKEIEGKYNVILNGKTKGTTVDFKGIPLIDFLTAGGVKTEGVQFVKVRYGNSDAAGISLITLDPNNTERPPMILNSGAKPGRGQFRTPSVVPGQPNLNQAMAEADIVYFKTGSGVEAIKLVPGKPGARIMEVRISGADKRGKNGQFTLTASIPRGGNSNKNKTYEWYGEDAEGNPVTISGSGKTVVTKDGTTANAVRNVRVIVTQSDGSTGAASTDYKSVKKAKGTTKDPDPPPTPTTGSNTGSGTGAGTGLNGGAVNSFPGGTQTNPGTQAIPPPTAQTTTPPTNSTGGETSSDVDSAAITNVAQNVSGTGGLQTVTGVLLSSPTTAPAAEGGSSPITALPPAVANELNSIFQPVNDVDDAWVYLLALLFAFTFSGAVREWVKP